MEDMVTESLNKNPFLGARAVLNRALGGFSV
jgi:hypothetical protein